MNYTIGEIEPPADGASSWTVHLDRKRPWHGGCIVVYGEDKTELFREVVAIIDALNTPEVSLT